MPSHFRVFGNSNLSARLGISWKCLICSITTFFIFLYTWHLLPFRFFSEMLGRHIISRACQKNNSISRLLLSSICSIVYLFSVLYFIPLEFNMYMDIQKMCQKIPIENYIIVHGMLPARMHSVLWTVILACHAPNQASAHWDPAMLLFLNILVTL